MDRITEVLNSDYNIENIVIYNFANLDEKLNIEINLSSHKLGIKKIFFHEVKGINVIDEYYCCSSNIRILIEDINSAQLENIAYKVSISLDAMTFYCKEISLIPG